MRRAVLLVVALLVLAGCSSAGPRAASDASTASTAVSSSQTSATTSAALDLPGATACRSLIENDGDVYQLLNDLVTKGTASGEYKAQLDIGTLSSSTSMFDGQVEDPSLAAALHSIETDARPVESAVEAEQPVRPEPLRTDLTDAARLCEQHGIPISWYSGS